MIYNSIGSHASSADYSENYLLYLDFNKTYITMNKTDSDFDIIECICSWCDLLGYGQPLKDSNWNLNDKMCESQLLRIKSLDLSRVNRFSGAHHAISFTLNDGIIYNFDINPRDIQFKDHLVMVLDDLIGEYESLNIRDSRNGYPGVRGVITFGHRYNYVDVESTVNVADNFTSSYHPRVFQMNTAFSKAYLMESSGSKAGISGNSLYIDKYLFNRIEDLILKTDDSSIKYRVEKNLYEIQDDLYFSIFRNNEIFLRLELSKDFIEYNHNGINTTLYKFVNKISLQDNIAAENAYRRSLALAQMESEEL